MSNVVWGFPSPSQTVVSDQPKRYKALLNQSGIDAPVATILENTLGGVPVWTRHSVGYYYCTLAGAFPIDKIFCTVTFGFDWGNKAICWFGKAGALGSDIVTLKFEAPDGTQLDVQNDPGNDICVLIEVYP